MNAHTGYVNGFKDHGLHQGALVFQVALLLTPQIYHHSQHKSQVTHQVLKIPYNERARSTLATK